jgi:hypothetical protein
MISLYFQFFVETPHRWKTVKNNDMNIQDDNVPPLDAFSSEIESQRLLSAIDGSTQSLPTVVVPLKKTLNAMQVALLI